MSGMSRLNPKIVRASQRSAWTGGSRRASCRASTRDFAYTSVFDDESAKVLCKSDGLVLDLGAADDVSRDSVEVGPEAAAVPTGSAAELLGLKPSTLRYRMQKLGIYASIESFRDTSGAIRAIVAKLG